MKKKQSIAVIGPNPIQSNPWMDPIHVQLCCTAQVNQYNARSCV